MTTEWITPEQLAEMTGLSLSRLVNQRCDRVVFPHYPIPGTRAVVYNKAEVDRIIAAARIGTVEEEPLPGVDIGKQKPAGGAAGQNINN